MAWDAAQMDSRTQAPGAPPSSDIRHAIETELEAICSDVQFRTSRRNCAFLHYVVTETLAGRSAEIKERTLGTVLFGRPISYDTGSDAVVRVRANEVRKRLACYYEEHESKAGWRVQLPLRTYVPSFLPDDALAPTGPVTASNEPSYTLEASSNDRSLLTLAQMMIPTLIALFLCAATFRWQIFSGTPYLDFWETVLAGHSGIALVLDADSADSRAVTIDDIRAVQPLMQTAAAFDARAQVRSSSSVKPNGTDLVPIHITHRSPLPSDAQAAFITVIPGRTPELWVGSGSPAALDLAIHSMSSTDAFPSALEMAIHRKAPSRLRFAERQQVTMQTASAAGESWPR